MIEVNEDNFQNETAVGLVLVDFYTVRCPPCKALSPILESLDGIKIIKVNAEDNINLCMDYNVTNVPCLIFLKDGKEIQKLVGLQKKDVLQNLINQLR